MKSNRILLITSEFPPQPGGIGTHAYQLGKALTSEGKTVTILCDQRSVDGQEEAEFDRELPFQVVRIRRRKQMVVAYFQRLSKALTLSKSHDTWIFSGKFSLWLLPILSNLRKGRTLAVIHGSELLLPIPWQRKRVEKALMRADAVVAVSHYTQSLVKHLPLKYQKVIPNGFEVPNETLSSAPKALSESLKLITVGNVTARKGQHLVIDALPALTKHFPDLEYHVVGIPTEAKNLLAQAKELGVLNLLKIHGRLQENQKIQLLNKCTIFIMLSERTEAGDVEGFGIAILEANALGLPAIGALGSGIEDAIKNEFSGKLVHPRSEKEILNAVTQIKDHYEAYSENAKEWSKGFTWEKIVKLYLTVLDS